MDTDKKNGVLLIILAFCIPLAALPFVTGFSQDKSLYDNLYKSGIELRKDTRGESRASAAPEKKVNLKKLIPERIPFRLFLAVTVILLYAGIIKIDRARRRARGEYDAPQHDNDHRAPPQEPG